MFPRNYYLNQGVEGFNSSKHAVTRDGEYEFPFNGSGKVIVRVTTKDGVRQLDSSIVLPQHELDRRWTRKLQVVLPFRRHPQMKETFDRRGKAVIPEVPPVNLKIRMEFHPGKVATRERNFHQQVKARRG